MANQRKISYEIDYKVNQASLNNVKKAIEDIRKNFKSADLMKINPKLSEEAARQVLRDSREIASKIEDMLEDAYNPKLDTFNNSAFRQGLKENNISIQELHKTFSNFGITGEKAFLDIAGAISTTKTPIKESHKLLNEMATTLTKTLKWNIASSAINKVTGSVQEAYGYVKALDSSLNDIRIVTNKNAEAMKEFAEQANRAAKSLGTGTKDYTNASLTFYQQGLGDAEVQARAETTLKVANVSGLSAEDSAEYVTSVTNGYKLAANEVENAMDKLSAVGAATASDLAELSEGMSKVASTANSMGVSQDQLAATLATVISTTRQDASSVGTAFKTIYARISDIEAGAADAEVTLGEYTSKMADLGFSVLDSSGHLKDLGSVMEDIGGSWANLTKEQQISLAQTMAGTRQYNNLIALFDNWDEYTRSLNVSLNANGTLQQQQNIYMESTEAHLQKLTTNLEDLYDSILDADTINGVSDMLSGFVSGITAVIDGLGGGGNALLTFGSIATTVFRKQISQGIATTINNFKTAIKTTEDYKAQLQNIDDLKDIGDEGLTRLAEMHKTYAQYSNFMNEEEKEAYQAQIQEQVLLEKKAKDWKAAKTAAESYLKVLNRDSKDPTENSTGYQINSGATEEDAIGNLDNLGENELLENISAMQVLEEAANEAQEAQKNIATSQKDIIKQKKLYKIATDGETEATENNAAQTRIATKAQEEIKKDYQAMIPNLENLEDAYVKLEFAMKGISDKKELLGLEGDDFDVAEGDIQKFIQKIEHLKEELNSTDFIDEDKVSKEIQEILTKYNKIVEEIKQKSKIAGKAMEEALENKSTEKTPEQIAKENQRRQLEKARLQAETQLKVQAFSEVAGAAMSLTSAMQTLVNIWDIWNNPDLSAGEKIAQTIGGIIPVVISLTTSIWGMKTAANAATISFWPLLVISAGLAVLVGTVTLLSKVIVTQEEKMKNAAKTVEDLTSKYDELTTAAENFKNSVSEYNDAIKALEDLEKSTQEYNEALELANEKAKELIKTYSLWDDYKWENGQIIIDETALQNKQNQQEQQLNNLEQSRLLAEQGATKEALKYQTTVVADTVVKTINNPDIFGWTSWAYEEPIQEIIDSAVQGVQEGKFLSVEEAVNKMIDSLDEGESEREKIIKKSSSALVGLANATLEAKNANEIFADQMIESAIKEEHGEQIRAIATTVDEKTGEAKTDEALINTLTQAAAEKSKKDNEETAEALKNVSDLVEEQTNEEFNGWDDDVDFNAWMNKIQTVNGEERGSINSWLVEKGGEEVNIDGDEDIARLYAQKVLGMSEEEAAALKYSGGIGESTLTYTTAYTDASGVTHKAGEAVIEGMSETEQINAIARSYLTDFLKDQYANDTSTNTETFLKQIDVLSKNISDDYGDIGSGILNALANGDITDIKLSNITAGLSREDYEDLKNADNDELVKKLNLENINFEALGYKNSAQLIEAIQDGLGEWDASAWTDTLVAASKEAVTQTKSLLEDLKSDKITAENIVDSESFKSLSSELDKIVKEYPELQEEQEFLNKTWLAGTKAYEENLENIQQKLADIKIETEAADAKEAYDDFVLKVDIKANPEEFTDEMDKLLEQEYEVDVAIHAAAEEAFSSMSDSINEISEQASAIGENFIVSANDIRELNNTFPGILEGMTMLADGSIQLNQQVVSSAIGAAEAEAKADAQATLEKLNNQAITLRAKQKTYQDMANAAFTLAKGETEIEKTGADARAVISGGLADLQNYNSNATAEQAKIDNKETVDSSVTSSQSVAKNWEAAYQSVNEAAYQAAKNQIDYMNGVEAKNLGEKGSVKGIEYKGSTDTGATETDVITKTEGLIKIETYGDKEREAWEEIGNQFQALADSSGDSATDIEGMMAQIGAMGGTLSTTFDNISSGLGSSNKKTKDLIDLLESELDLYREINNEIEEINRTLEDLTNQQKQLMGPALIKNLDEQLNLLEKQADAYERKIKIAEQEASVQAARLRGYGITFDESGQMSNYEALYLKKQSEINAQIAEYNNSGKKEEQKQAIENSKKQLEELSKIASKYDELLNNTLPGIADELEEVAEKEYEIKIEKIEVAVQEATEKADWSKIYDEYLNTRQYEKEDIVGQATLTAGSSQTQALIRDRMNEEFRRASAARNALDIIDKGGTDENYGANRAKAFEDAKKYGEAVIKSVQELYSNIDSLNKNVISGIDEVENAYNGLNSVYSEIEKTYNSGLQLMKLLYGEDNYTGLNAYYQKNQINYERQLASLRQEKAYWQELMSTVEENSEEWKKYKDNFISASNELTATLEKTIQNIIDTYTNSINEIFDKLEKSLTDNLGLDYINEEWTLIKDNSEQYLDAVNSAYSIQATKSKYLDAINQAEDAETQQRINDLMQEQIKKLEEKDKLTQYDVERAEKLLNIELKRIALQEAQQNKSKMRLRRNANGDYSYQFVADEDQISAAQQELADAENDLYNFDLEEYNESLDRAYSLYSEYQEKVLEVYTNTTLTQEERDRQLHLLNMQYAEAMAQVAERNTTAKVNLENSANEAIKQYYTDNQSAFEGMIDEEGNLIMNKLVPSWGSGVQTMIDKIIQEGGLDNVMQQTLEDANEAIIKLSEEEQKAADIAGEDLEDIASANNEIANILEDDVAGAAQDVLSKAQDNLEKVQDIRNEYQGWADDIENTLIPKYDNLISTINTAILRAQELAAEASRNYSINTSGYVAPTISGSGSGSGSSSNGGGSKVTPPPAPKLKEKPQLGILYKNYSDYEKKNNGQKYRKGSTIQPLGNGVYLYKDLEQNQMDSVLPYASYTVDGTVNGRYGTLLKLKRGNIIRYFNNHYGAIVQKYDTGGYTGAWGSEGRLAMLHQKELVLNAKDTKNMLSAVNILRTITANLGESIFERIANIPVGINKSLQHLNSETLEQNVHIEASFPNVTKSTEIEDAINNLVNIASQRALRNDK